MIFMKLIVIYCLIIIKRIHLNLETELKTVRSWLRAEGTEFD